MQGSVILKHKVREEGEVNRHYRALVTLVKRKKPATLYQGNSINEESPLRNSSSRIYVMAKNCGITEDTLD